MKMKCLGCLLITVSVMISMAFGSGPEPTKKPTLVEAANAAKNKRNQVGSSAAKPKLVITDETVAANKHKGQMTTVAQEQYTPTAYPLPRTEDEKIEYWRGRYKTQKRIIEALETEIAQLDKSIPEYWRDFYAEDDPLKREREIKPKLDATLSKRHDLEKRLEIENEKPAAILRDARDDGAYAGWFRDLK